MVEHCCLECRRRNGVVVRRKEARGTPGLPSLYLHPDFHHLSSSSNGGVHGNMVGPYIHLSWV